MRLKFEVWIEKGSFSVDAKHLLNSGATCYKAEAYSAALLMSYLGFLVIIKDRLMSSPKPGKFPQGQWDKIIKTIQLEDQWEAAVIDALKQQEVRSGAIRTKDPVFTCNDSIRAQIVYWKDRRNDCVHHKDNEITNAHVETFWSFLESNLQKITVPGGMTSLLNKFELFYDTTYTAANQDVAPLIAEIKGAVEKAELDDFWKSLFDVMNDLIDYDREVVLIYKVFKLADADLDVSLLKYLKSQPGLLKEYIGNYPQIIQNLGYSAQEIRNLWQTKLLKGPNPLKVYAYMLRTELIPETEIPEANKLFAKKLKYTITGADHQTLMDHGFGDSIYNVLFVERDPSAHGYWQYLHDNSAVTKAYVELYPLKDEVVTILSNLFNSTYYPYGLQTALQNLFTTDSKKKKEFLDIADRLSLTIPSTVIPALMP